MHEKHRRSVDILPATLGSRTGGPSFSLRHRFERAIWAVAWKLLAAWTPPPMHSWRRTVLRIFGATMAPNTRVYGSTNIWYPRNLTMQQNAVLGPGVVCYCMASITIGENAIVSQRSHLCAGTHNVDDPLFELQAVPIRIEAYAWVAAEAFVGPGVCVGKGAVLGARGVAAKDLVPWTVYVGNPAKPVRQRTKFELPDAEVSSS